MKRKIVILSTVLAGVVLILLGFLSFADHSMQDSVEFSETADRCAYYPINSGMVTVADGVRMLFDTASPVSTITAADLARLAELNCDVDSVTGVYLGLGSDDQFYFTTKRYVVSLPAPDLALAVADSVCSPFATYCPEGAVIRNLTFLPSTDGESHIGIDILSKFVVEYSWTTGMVVLRDSVPGDFQYFADIDTEMSPRMIFSSGARRFISLEVDNRRDSYMINTSISRIMLNIPEGDGPTASHAVDDPYLLNGNYVTALREPDQLVRIGDRAKYQDIHRSNATDNCATYFCNPLNMFVFDVIMDLPSNRFYIRKGARMISHSPRFGLAAE